MARKWFNFQEITKALKDASIESIIIEKITLRLPLHNKRESTDEEKRLKKELTEQTARKELAIEHLQFWKKHAKLIGKKEMEEEINKQINCVKVHGLPNKDK